MCTRATFFQTALRLAKATADPAYHFGAAWAMHAAIGPDAAAAAAAATEEAAAVALPPNATTGGGRQWLVSRVEGPAASSLRLADTLMERALDGMPPSERDAERVGLYLHTLVRQGKAAAALAAISAGGKYCEAVGLSASPHASAASPVSGSDDDERPCVPRHELGPEEDVAVIADGRGGRGRSPGLMQEVDYLRHSAYLATIVGVERHPITGLGGVISTPASCSEAAAAAAHAAWTAALDFYGALLLRIDAADWAYHCGVAYSVARLAVLRAEGAPTAGEALLSAAADLTAAAAVGVGGGAVLVGRSELDALLAGPIALADDAAAAAASAAEAPGGLTALPACHPEHHVSSARGMLLSALQLLAVRMEVAHRLLQQATTAAVPADAHAVIALRGALAAASARYVSLLSGAFAVLSHKACVFSDLKPFLTPLLPLTSTAASPAASASVAGFLSPEAPILAMPFSPLAPAGSAADTAPRHALFSWSFTVSEADAAPFFRLLQSTATVAVPDAQFALQMRRLHAAARQAATASAAAEAASADASLLQSLEASTAKLTVKKGGVGKGGSGGGGKAGKKGGAPPPSTDGDDDDHQQQDEAAVGSSSSSSSTDPHGVQSVLSPVLPVAFTPEQEREVTSARHRVRRFTAAQQLTRYLGRCSRSPNGVAPLTSADAGRVAALTAAWTHTLPLSALTAAASSQREVEEGDDLVLLAAQGLWELAFTAITDGGEASGTLSSPAPSALRAARRHLVESALLLECGAHHSPTNAQFHLAAARVYGWLGLNACVLTHWRALRVKHVLCDTLNYVAMPHVLRLTWLETLKDVCDEVHTYHK